MSKGFKKKNRIRMTHSQIIALGFFLVIVMGTLLLMLPVSTKSGASASFTEAFFTAVSSSCVTGLIVQDTFAFWSVFGQCVILVMIQIGGLGFITISTFFFLLLRRRIGLRDREVLSESINTTQIGGILRLTKLIVWGTAIIELAGAALLSIRFCPELGIVRGIYYSVFHSVSAFCNAGFDLCGIFGEYSSLSHFADDVLVNAVIITLIILGGLGFIVWSDVREHKFKLKKYRLHSKIVLFTSAVLVLGGALVFFMAENDASLSGLSEGEKLLASLFSSVTARTAGFNTVDMAELTGAGKLVMCILMFIGGSPGSTAGGIKTTTVAVIILYSTAFMRKNKTTGVYGRRFPEDTLKRANTVFFTNLTLTLIAVVILGILNDIDITDILFECFSASGTVGISTGITRDVTLASKYILAFLMFCGRVGSVSFATALVEKRVQPVVAYPAENITIG